MDLRTGTATCVEKHFSHKFRTPFSPGQIFGLVPIDYRSLNSAELDICLLYSHCVDGDLFPSKIYKELTIKPSRCGQGREIHLHIGERRQPKFWFIYNEKEERGCNWHLLRNFYL